MKRSRELEDDSDRYQRSDSPIETTAAANSPRSRKIVEVDSAVEDHEDAIMKCSLPPHREPLAFTTYEEYESHYHKDHMHRCVDCRRNLPSEHLLGVHIEECHDPLMAILREKGEHTFSCFVEGCERKCSTHQKRRMHLIDKHGFPKNYFFAVTRDGIDGRRSLLNDGHYRRRSSTHSQNKEPTWKESVSRGTEADQQVSIAAFERTGNSQTQSADAEMADLTDSMSALRFVPPSIRFGRGGSGFSRI